MCESACGRRDVSLSLFFRFLLWTYPVGTAPSANVVSRGRPTVSLHGGVLLTLSFGRKYLPCLDALTERQSLRIPACHPWSLASNHNDEVICRVYLRIVSPTVFLNRAV